MFTQGKFDEIAGEPKLHTGQKDDSTQHSAADIEIVADHHRACPIIAYKGYRPLIERLMTGEKSLLLGEEPMGWPIIRGERSNTATVPGSVWSAYLGELCSSG